MQQKKSQIERLNDELQKIREDVTETDKSAFREASDLSVTIVSNYLNGKAAKIETAITMLSFFKNRIKERDLVIETLKN